VRKTDTTPDSSTEPDEVGGFYGRWSRRKQQARTGNPAPEDEAAGSPAETRAGGLAEDHSPPQAAALTDADMPALESLDADSDYSGFLSEGVSDELRNKALRKLFLSPQFNVVDGLDDYCEDFTSFEALGDIVTADMHYERECEARLARERAGGDPADETRIEADAITADPEQQSSLPESQPVAAPAAGEAGDDAADEDEPGGQLAKAGDTAAATDSASQETPEPESRTDSPGGARP